MFEKEAEERYKQHLADPNYYESSEEESYLRGFREGAEFAYNKANEWHYVKDCLPEEDVYVWLWCKNDTFPVVACRHTFTSWGRTDWEWDCKWGSGFEIKQNDPKVIAWKDIVLSKEIESC